MSKEQRNTGRLSCDPVFVIGPGRSGTTLLYKLLCLHPKVAYLTNLEQKLPWLPVALTARVRLRNQAHQLRCWFNQAGNAYLARRPLATRVTPAPVEAEAVYARCGVPLFPGPDFVPDDSVVHAMRSVFAQVQSASKASLVVSKRTANNRRLALLREVFPHARYVNVVRDGREVAASLARVGWWNEHRLWWDADRRTPAQAVADGDNMLRLCAHNWVVETEHILEGLRAVPRSQVLCVRFEELVASPVRQMGRVLDFLSLERRDDYESALGELRVEHRPGAWRRRWSAQEIEIVNSEQRECLARLGYAS